MRRAPLTHSLWINFIWRNINEHHINCGSTEIHQKHIWHFLIFQRRQYTKCFRLFIRNTLEGVFQDLHCTLMVLSILCWNICLCFIWIHMTSFSYTCTWKYYNANNDWVLHAILLIHIHSKMRDSSTLIQGGRRSPAVACWASDHCLGR